MSLARLILVLAIAYVVSGFLTAEASAKAVSRTVAALPQAARTTNDAVFTAEQAKRGEVLYQFICATCHGPALTGIEAAPPLAGTTFGASWTGAVVGDLFERIRVSMPQDKPGTLGRQQAADVVAYILSFNKAPAGRAELPGDAEVLKAITIVSPQ
jgi:S-disulfanyl-L-cysteine oxidoreductase SoxD